MPEVFEALYVPEVFEVPRLRRVVQDFISPSALCLRSSRRTACLRSSGRSTCLGSSRHSDCGGCDGSRLQLAGCSVPEVFEARYMPVVFAALYVPEVSECTPTAAGEMGQDFNSPTALCLRSSKRATCLRSSRRSTCLRSSRHSDCSG